MRSWPQRWEITDMSSIEKRDELLIRLTNRVSQLETGPNTNPSATDQLRTLLAEFYLDEAEVAARWGVSRELLQKHRRLRGGVPYIRFSAGIIRYSILDVLQYEEQCRCNPEHKV